MKGVVPAAGEGTRMGALTDNRPKGMVKVAGKPILEYVFTTLRNIGVEEIIVIVGSEASSIVDHFGEEYNGVPIRYVHQRVRNGLASAVLLVEPHIEEEFVVLNGDNVFVDEPSPQVKQAQESDVDGYVLVEKTSEEKARTTGVIQTTNGYVTSLTEKPEDPDSNLITTGCYILPPEIFDACRLLRPSQRGEYELTEAIDLLIRGGAKIEAVRFDGYRCNVNTPADIDTVERRLTQE